jgi:RNA polymerase sigma factor (sigma-70 family)
MRPDAPQHFNEISTSSTLFRLAHDPGELPERRNDARQVLVCRYLGAVRRYLAGALRGDPQGDVVVDELMSDFSLRIMEGKLQTFDAEHGRFRIYLRTILQNLVRDYHRRRYSLPGQMREAMPEVAEEAFDEQAFQQELRVAVTMHALEAMRTSVQANDDVLYTVLKLKADNSKLTAAVLAEELSTKLGREVNAKWVSKQLERARKRMRELVRLEVRESLQDPSEDSIDEELADLGMLEYVRDRRPAE